MKSYQVTTCFTVFFIVFSLSIFTPTVVFAEQFGGVGLQVAPTSGGQLVVLRVVSETPAAKAGLLAGDMIDKIGPVNLQGQSFEDVVRRHLWGPVGSSIEISYRRPGVAGQHLVTVVRKLVNRPKTELSGVKTVQPESGQ